MKNLVLLQHNVLSDSEDSGYTSSKLCFDSANKNTYVAQIFQDECRILRSNEKLLEFKELVAFPVMNADQSLSVISIKYLMDSESLCICFSNGEIAVIPEGTPDLIDYVGSVDSGLLSIAWSPDEELFAAYTGEHKLLIMTKDFEVLSENFVHVEEKGQEFYANVGWGKKETQFHGSEGKQAAQVKQNTSNFNLSVDDDGQPRLSWRGDGNYLSCSAIDLSRNLRLVRIYDREGILQNTSEPVDQLEHTLDWRPSGNLIASTQRLPHRYQVVFFERNGLRHGEFTLPTDIRTVVDMKWNCDSTVLALSVVKEIEGSLYPFLQLWNMNNYFWYLKYEIPVCSASLKFTDFIFDPENALALTTLLSNGVATKYDFCWSNYVSESLSKDSASLAASIHGSSIFLTPFRYRNVPPPMSAYQPKVQNSIIHLAFAGFGSGNNFATLSSDQRVDLFVYSKGNEKCNLIPENMFSFKLTEASEAYDVTYRQICFPTSDSIFALGFCSSLKKEVLGKFYFPTSSTELKKSSLILPEFITRLCLNPLSALPLLHSSKGSIFQIQEVENQLSTSFLTTLPESCNWIQFIPRYENQTPVAVSLSRRNKLYVNGGLVEMNCTSFFVHNEFVVYSTVEHLARFYPINDNTLNSQQKEDIQAFESYSRNLERGSKIILAVPHSVSLVLQMPRGNLETVYPRTLVLASIRNSLKNQDYRSAFISCRKYRIDMNVLYDENPSALMEDIEMFVNQINEPEHLNLFISGLKEENVASSKYPKLIEDKPSEHFEQKVNKICGALREVLLSKDKKTYTQSIVTTYARQSPPDYESILRLLKKLKASDISFAEETLKYAIFLANVDHLFDVALGMYDFSLVLMVAQQSQKDPKEYLPFLSELQKLDENYRFFKIDDYLKKHGSALRNLAKSEDRFEECLKYVEKHELYLLAQEIFKDQPERYTAIMEIFGNYLMEKKQYSDAGSAFISVENYQRAIPAFIKTGNWQLALTSSKRLDYSTESTLELIEELCNVLKHNNRHLEAAKLIETYKKDPEEIIVCLIEGHHWLDAIFTSEFYLRKDLIETDITPAVNFVYDQMKEDIQDMQEQFFKQRHRVQELLNKPPPTYADDPSLENIDVMSDASSVFTNFTVYTQSISQASAKSSGSSKTGKSRRKIERKKNQGKKGSVFEYEYLLGSVSRLVERANNMHTDLNKTLNALCVLKLVTLAKLLQTQFETFLFEIESHLDEIYKEPKAATGIEALIMANKSAFEKVPKPVLTTSKKWKLAILSSK